ncbi:hypothetical protein GLAREA_01084 [Glarea lozoyensis ATCC 20868]|uniref:Uncharacterized protein n=1 Tax=Glarea lozoyensis (strain ATCC 20868 / MF5171) TaxID=1116229 RepID=S3CY90_GLAL2|nr:uncharacterized protein GLAREA_01084 [Glarea lozoyensis ATCC 20868]EPE29924.1 hypothetical protein GLAREA_01084 [Glarea lozoyensis ATCC 20868]
MAAAASLSPTFVGHIASTQDALILFEACLNGTLNHVARRPHDRERSSLIKSGNVFIYEEHSSGIKRWTDGVPWSPSRILGNFLVYRELERPFPPGEKKRAMKRSKRSPGISKAQELFGTSGSGIGSNYNTSSISSYLDSSNNSLSKETERSLIGSLVDSYGFKDEGLVKKTVSVTVRGVSHHLVSYYTVADVMNNKFSTPSKDARFQHITPRNDLITKQNFRTPIDEVDSMDSTDRAMYSTYSGNFPRTGYEMTNQSLANRPMSLPMPPVQYAPSNVYGSYTMSTPSCQDGLPSSYPLGSYTNQFASSPGVYNTSKAEPYEVEGGYGRQRFNSVVSLPSEHSRTHGPPPVSTNFDRRGSLFDHSTESSLSGISTTSIDSKMSGDSGYASQSYYGHNYKENSQPHHSYHGERSLPAPPPQAPTPHPFLCTENSGTEKGIWSMPGNSGGGHGHYVASHQQQWASTGSS